MKLIKVHAHFEFSSSINRLDLCHDRIVVRYDGGVKYTLAASMDLNSASNFRWMLTLGWLEKDFQDCDRVGELLKKS